jgi:hypothetical protein
MSGNMLDGFINNESGSVAYFKRLSALSTKFFWEDAGTNAMAMWIMSHPPCNGPQWRAEEIPEGVDIYAGLSALQNLVSVYPVLAENFPHIKDLVLVQGNGSGEESKIRVVVGKGVPFNVVVIPPRKMSGKMGLFWYKGKVVATCEHEEEMDETARVCICCSRNHIYGVSGSMALLLRSNPCRKVGSRSGEIPTVRVFSV